MYGVYRSLVRVYESIGDSEKVGDFAYFFTFWKKITSSRWKIGRNEQVTYMLFAVTLHRQKHDEFMNKTEQQQEATRFSFDYFKFLLHQEDTIDRMLERKINQLEPRLEELINEKINERLRSKD